MSGPALALAQRTSALNELIRWLTEIHKETDEGGEPWITECTGLGAHTPPICRLKSYLKIILVSIDDARILAEYILDYLQTETLKTVCFIAEAFLGNQGDKQKLVSSAIATSVDKLQFVYYHVLPRIVKSQYHNKYVDALCIYNFLEHLQKLYDKFCRHSKLDVAQTLVHLEGKAYLSSCAQVVWASLLEQVEQKLLAHDRNNVALDQEYLIPQLRRLAIRDILDADWDYFGGWKGLFVAIDDKLFHGLSQYLENPCDLELHRTTKQLRKARNSLRCQCIAFAKRSGRCLGATLGLDLDPQCYRYLAKCSARLCANFETPQQPHVLRCTQCCYYHWCSEGCKVYSTVYTDHHPKYCSAVPFAKVQQTIVEAQGFFRTIDTKTRNKERCAVCSVYSSIQPLTPCDKCHSVPYCSTACQEWGWEHGGHKQECVVLSLLNKKETVLGDG